MGNLFKTDDNKINNAEIANTFFNVNLNKQFLLQIADAVILNLFIILFIFALFYIDFQ